MILSQREKQQRAAYMRKYRKRNPLQTAETNMRYWNRRVKQLRAAEAQNKEKEK